MRNLFTFSYRRRGTLFVLMIGLLTIGVVSRAAENTPAKDTKDQVNDPVPDAARIANSAAKPKPLRILVVGGHPADVFDQSGGTMAHHIQRGDWVGCAVVTTGVRVHDKVIANEMQHRQKIPDAEELKKTMAKRAEVKKRKLFTLVRCWVFANKMCISWARTMRCCWSTKKWSAKSRRSFANFVPTSSSRITHSKMQPSAQHMPSQGSWSCMPCPSPRAWILAIRHHRTK